MHITVVIHLNCVCLGVGTWFGSFDFKVFCALWLIQLHIIILTQTEKKNHYKKYVNVY